MRICGGAKSLGSRVYLVVHAILGFPDCTFFYVHFLELFKPIIWCTSTFGSMTINSVFLPHLIFDSLKKITFSVCFKIAENKFYTCASNVKTAHFPSELQKSWQSCVILTAHSRCSIKSSELKLIVDNKYLYYKKNFLVYPYVAF